MSGGLHLMPAGTEMHRVVEQPDNPAIRGMVNKIPHLVRIVDDSAQA